MMKITNDWLDEKDACSGGKEWFKNQDESDGVKVVKKLMDEQKLDWANWLIVRIMERKQHLQYAVFAAEQVLEVFEKKYPDDKRPRLAIEAARKCLENDNAENRTASASSASASASASYAAAASSASASASAYAYAAAASAYAAAAKRDEMKIKILNYGLELLTGE
jgi:hypothetical protein